MSMLIAPLPPTSDSEYFQGAWSRFFGKFIASGREKAGLSVEQAASLAGMKAAEWSAIEAGASLPTTSSSPSQMLCISSGPRWPGSSRCAARPGA